MEYQELRTHFHQQVYPSQPNEWDIEDALVDLEDLSDEKQKLLLESLPTVWPISHSLSFSVLKEGARYARDLERDSLAEWLRRVLHCYEQGGLKEARAYMAEANPACLDDEENRLTIVLDAHFSRMTAFARGMSGLDITLQQAGNVYTDTETIYLPEKICLFAGAEANLLFYKLIIALQTSFIRLGSLNHRRLVPRSDEGEAGQPVRRAIADAFFHRYPIPRLARDLYQLMELYRAFRLIGEEYPGLMRETRELRQQIIAQRVAVKEEDDPLEQLFGAIVLRDVGGQTELLTILRENRDFSHPAEVLELLYDTCASREGTGRDFSFSPLMGFFDFAEAQRAIERRIVENKKRFATALAELLQKKDLVAANDEEREAPAAAQADAAKIMLVEADEGQGETRRPALSLDNAAIELPDDICQLIESIEADLGRLPQGYVSAAFGIAGRARMTEEGADDGAAEPSEMFIPYDEWDYRRHGYRKSWCSLRERTLKGVKTDFVERTREKHHGILMKIRRQFEAMRTQERFVRRQRHGDDLDLDAVIDSLGDQRAGLPPSEQLFVRLVRNERSISTLFLVDMSNSTEGWIGIVIKEALVLLCEAMESVGDRYGIYGFSGMRRMRSEVYEIKGIDEPYRDEVKARIAAISPKEYTRMGPPIRHLTRKLATVDAKSQVMIILSDGKPEDYDAYKGRYAIEDTRKALAEARGRGIHPYCITIDREAHDYLEYLFGRGNYTYIKDVQRLPSRLAEIYRLLTR